MSFHAFVVIVESDDVEQAAARMNEATTATDVNPGWYVFTSVPWEVRPFNDYTNAEAEFGVDDVLEQRR